MEINSPVGLLFNETIKVVANDGAGTQNLEMIGDTLKIELNNFLNLGELSLDPYPNGDSVREFSEVLIKNVENYHNQVLIEFTYSYFAKSINVPDADVSLYTREFRLMLDAVTGLALKPR